MLKWASHLSYFTRSTYWLFYTAKHSFLISFSAFGILKKNQKTRNFPLEMISNLGEEDKVLFIVEWWRRAGYSQRTSITSLEPSSTACTEPDIQISEFSEFYQVYDLCEGLGKLTILLQNCLYVSPVAHCCSIYLCHLGCDRHNYSWKLRILGLQDLGGKFGCGLLVLGSLWTSVTSLQPASQRTLLSAKHCDSMFYSSL